MLIPSHTVYVGCVLAWNFETKNINKNKKLEEEVSKPLVF